MSFINELKAKVGSSFGNDLIELALEKAIEQAVSSGKAEFYDPLTMMTGFPWMTPTNNGGLTPLDLRMSARNPIISSIVRTRCAQIASFCTPQIEASEPGFRVTAKKDAGISDSELANITSWLATAGDVDMGVGSFEMFARKVMYDSLTLDQAAAEVVLRRNKLPSYMVPVDSATIYRLPDSLRKPNDRTVPHFVQVINGQSVVDFTKDELMVGYRNQTTDIGRSGYGYPELELLVRTVTALQSLDALNASSVGAGGTTRGIFVLRGDADQAQYDIFKRDLRTAVRNASQAWRPPVVKVSEKAQVEWVSLDRSVRDMEYGALMESLVKIACSVYQMDPSEISWTTAAHGTSTTFSSDGDAKIRASQARGLKPLLTFLAQYVNSNILWKINPNLSMSFVGMNVDPKAEQEALVKAVTHYDTVNEVRAKIGKPSLGPRGDVILNQFFLRDELEGYTEVADDGTDQST